MHVAQQRVARGRHRETGRRHAHVDMAHVAGVGTQQADRQLVGHPRRDEGDGEADDAHVAAGHQRARAQRAFPAELSAAARRLAAGQRGAADARAERHLGRRRRAGAEPHEVLHVQLQLAQLRAQRRQVLLGMQRRVGELHQAVVQGRAVHLHVPGRRGRGGWRRRRRRGGGRVRAQPLRDVEPAARVARDLHVRVDQLHAGDGHGARGHVQLQVGQGELVPVRGRGRAGGLHAQRVQRGVRDGDAQRGRVGPGGPRQRRPRAEAAVDARHQRLREVGRQRLQRQVGQRDRHLRLLRAGAAVEGQARRGRGGRGAGLRRLRADVGRQRERRRRRRRRSCPG